MRAGAGSVCRPWAVRAAIAAVLPLVVLGGCGTDGGGTEPPAPPRTHLEVSGRAHAPLLIALHGPEGSGGRLRHLAAFRLGDEGWGLAFPDAPQGGWMAPTPGGVERIEGLIRQLASEALADPKRVYVAGLSDGGQLALRLACERPDLVAGVAAVAASLPVGATCPGGAPVPVLMINATADPVLPYEGGPVAAAPPANVRLAGPVMAAGETAAILARNMGCGAARTVAMPDLAPDDGARVAARSYEGCAEPVVQFVVEGGGHGWPGSRPSGAMAEVLGTPARDISATLEIEAFFREADARR